jgi:toxin YoeB
MEFENNKKYTLELSKTAFKQLSKVKDKKLKTNILTILENIESNPYDPSYKFERLRGDKTGYCSKRLNQKDRIYYEVLQDKIIVYIFSILGHYDDK